MSEQDSPGSRPAVNGLFSQEDLERLQEVLTSSKLGSGPSRVSPKFKLVREFGRQSRPALIRPLAVALDPCGEILVIDRPGPELFRLHQFTADGSEGGTLAEFVKGPGDTELLEPVRCMADAQGQIFLLDGRASALKKFTRDGRWLDTFGSAGPGGTPLCGPRDFDLDGAGNLYLADTDNDRIVKLLPDGELGWGLDRLPGLAGGGEAGDLYEPSSVCTTTRSGIYIADSNHNRVICFDPEGSHVTVVGDAQRFMFPTRIRLSPDGLSLYVADNGDSRVQRLTSSGEQTACLSLGIQVEPTGFEAGADFVVDREARLVMVNLLRESVVVFDFAES